MEMITSRDGSTLAFDQLGGGPPLILVSGAMCDRRSDAVLADALAADFTVLNYDRRGRGDSTENGPYAVPREIEDLAALLDAAGGSAVLVGLSSGGALAALAAAALPAVTGLVGWEIPYRTEEAGRRAALDYRRRTDELLAAGRRGDAVELFLSTVGVPSAVVAGMMQSPFWADAQQVAPSLAHDAAVLDDGSVPVEALRRIGCPTLLLTGGASPPLFAAAATAAVAVLHDGAHRVLDGQRHDVAADVLAAAVRDFVGSPT